MAFADNERTTREHKTLEPEHKQLVIEERTKDLGVSVTQKHPADKVAAHKVVNEVVSPPVITTPPDKFRFNPVSASADIHELLFEVRRETSVFWVGVAVPKGTTDFTRAQVFFHPTVIQAGNVVAADSDYRDFKGGWRDVMHYVPDQGGQLAYAERRLPLVVPFTTMAAVQKVTKSGEAGPDNMFSERPINLLNAVMAASQKEVSPGVGAAARPELREIGVSSFSSGIQAMRLFLKAMSGSSLIKEVIDFDSPYIVREPKQLTTFPGAMSSKCFTQHPYPLPAPPPGWVTVKARHFELVTAYSKYEEPKRTHARIGWMMYYQAMWNSVIQ
jgi:hypothetical protein